MWKTKNGLNQDVTWYSENEYNKLKEENELLKNEQTENLRNQLLKERQKLEEIKDLCDFNSNSFDNGFQYVFVDEILELIEK